MKKVLLNESQMNLLLEEIKKNDLIQKLIFADPEKIDFEAESAIPAGVSVSRGMYYVKPIIDGTEIPTEYVKLMAEEVKVNGNEYYQLHIYVNPELRRLGIALKLYTAFIKQGYSICSLYSNRTASFYKDNDSTNDSDSAIENMWNKIASESGAKVEELTNNKGEKIGVAAHI